jgi:hypothetical protein
VEIAAGTIVAEANNSARRAIVDLPRGWSALVTRSAISADPAAGAAARIRSVSISIALGVAVRP